jgi:hypothetical protein
MLRAIYDSTGNMFSSQALQAQAISGIQKSLLSLSEIVAVVGDTAKLIDVIKDRMASLIHTSVTGGKVREVFVL